MGESSFRTIRERGYLYIDKTQYIAKLIRNSYYFLSRPRRFGKSLFLSTLEQFFLGNRELFKGLYIDTLDYDWQTYPIIRFDLSNGSYSREDGIEERLFECVEKSERRYDVTPAGKTPRARFNHLINALYQKYGKQVVILIDEYEKPLLDTVSKPFHEKYKGELHDFYSVLKDNSENIRFLFITGATRFGHLNIFSGLNNLYDISMEDEYSDICGISEQEIKIYLEPGIKNLSESRNLDYQATIAELKRNYDGYHFSDAMVDVYNPYSLLGCLISGKFTYSWFESGSSSFLVNLIKEKNYDLSEIEGIEVTGSRLKSINSSLTDPIPLLYQSGYLTIKSYSEDDRLYTLGYPNLEVKKGMLEILIPTYLNQPENSLSVPAVRIKEWLSEGKPEEVMEWLTGFFSRIPFDLHFKYEREFQFVICSIFNLMGLEDNLHVEQHTSRGSIDMTIEIEDKVYIFEFKVDKSAEAALQQIEAKRYSDSYRGLHKEIFYIGVKFDPSHHSIEEYKIRKYS